MQTYATVASLLSAATVATAAGPFVPTLSPALDVSSIPHAQGTVPIPGAKDLAQAKENLGALGWRLRSGVVMQRGEQLRGLGACALPGRRLQVCQLLPTCLQHYLSLPLAYLRGPAVMVRCGH